MRTDYITVSSLLLTVVVAAGCSERSALTAPAAGAQTLSSSGTITDRPYTWTFTCHGGSYVVAQWYWTANGTAILSGNAGCSLDGQVNGSGVRPADANGFTAQVGGNSQRWTFDPAGPFKASLSGSAFGACGKHVLVCLPYPKEDGKLTVDS